MSITIAPSIRFDSNAAASIALTTPPDWASETLTLDFDSNIEMMSPNPSELVSSTLGQAE
jgi:predicted transcriptional regulator